MNRKIKSEIPQIVSFSTISQNGVVRLKKAILEYINALEQQEINIELNSEIILSSSNGIKLPILKGNRIQLPHNFLKSLNIQNKSQICFVQRNGALALKKFEIKVKESSSPRIYDLESNFLVIRQIEGFGDPNQLKQSLEDNFESFKLEFNVSDFWRNKTSYRAWKVRKILGIKEESDEELRSKLIQERLSAQLQDGSWSKSVTQTAKNLKELINLGMTSNYPQIQQAIAWLMERPQSPYNPGMFFLTDELVKNQIELIERRKQQTRGSKERFRYRKKSEINIIRDVDELYYNSCGQRIMWPNAIVIETLLLLGYEFHERVQTAIETLTHSNWCECEYQHGTSGWKQKKSLTDKEIRQFEKQVLIEFKHCGISNFKQLSKIVSNHLMRINKHSTSEISEYNLRLPLPQQGCEYITAGALYKIKNDKLSKLVEAHLWRFAILLYNSLLQPEIAIEKERYGLTNYFQLQIISKYNSLPAKLAIYFALPWIKKNQNEDGTWGESHLKESATIAVLEALKNINLL